MIANAMKKNAKAKIWNPKAIPGARWICSSIESVCGVEVKYNARIATSMKIEPNSV